MKCKIILLLGLTVLTLSCQKITNVKLVDGISTGKLSYKVVDDSGNGMAGINVSIYDSKIIYSATSPNPNALIGTIKTNPEGIANFSDLLPENYLVTADSPVVNKVKYRTEEFVQIVADTEKKKAVKVTDFSGLLNITLISRNDYRSPLKNMGVVAFPGNGSQPSSAHIRAIINESPLKGVTDGNGFLSIKVPSNIYFDFIVYNLENGNFGSGYGIYTTAKNGKNTFSIYSYPL